MKPKPPTETITRERLCEITGLTDRRHRQLADLGYIPHPKDLRYKTEVTLAGVIKYLGEKNKKIGGDLKEEQKLLTKVRREQGEHNLSVSRGDFIPRNEVGPWIRNVGLNQRALLLRKFEQELAPKLAGKTTVEILDLIRGATDDVIRCYREGTARWATEEPK